MKKLAIIFTLLVGLIVTICFAGPWQSSHYVTDQNGISRKVKVWDSGFPGFIPSDQVTRAFDFTFAQTTGTSMTLASAPTVNSYTAILSAGHSIVANDLISFADLITVGHHFYSGKVLSISTNTVTLDTPIPHDFQPANTYVYERISDMDVDGSATTQVFSLTNPYPDAADITRVVFHMRNTTDMDSANFAGLTALTRGLVMRKKLSATQYHNYWNVKTTGELGALGTRVYDEKAPAGQYGVSIRITYAGMDRHGVAIRLEQGESLEVLVQDNLTALTYFRVVGQGHFTTEESDY